MMADSGQNDPRRRYAKPGEIDIAMLELELEQLRQGGDPDGTGGAVLTEVQEPGANPQRRPTSSLRTLTMPTRIPEARPVHSPPPVTEPRPNPIRTAAAPTEVYEVKPVPPAPRREVEPRANPVHSSAAVLTEVPESKPAPPPRRLDTEPHTSPVRNSTAPLTGIHEPRPAAPPPRVDAEPRSKTVPSSAVVTETLAAKTVPPPPIPDEQRHPIRTSTAPQTVMQQTKPEPPRRDEPRADLISNSSTTQPGIQQPKPVLPPPQLNQEPPPPHPVRSTAATPAAIHDAKPVPPPPPRVDAESHPSAVRNSAAPSTTRIPEGKPDPLPRRNPEPRENAARGTASSRVGIPAKPAPRAPRLHAAPHTSVVTRLSTFASTLVEEGRSALLNLLQYLNGRPTRHSGSLRVTPVRNAVTPQPAMQMAKAVPPPRLDGSLRANQVRTGSSPLSSKTVLGKKGVSARFELLPNHKPRWGRMGVSAAGQLAFLGFLLLTPMLFPQTMQTALKFDIVELMQPVTEVKVEPAKPEPPAPKPKPQPRPKIKPKTPPKAPDLKPDIPEPPPLLPQLNPKQPHIFMTLKPEIKKVRTVQEEAVDIKPVIKQQEEIVLSTAGPAAPPAPATVHAAADKVQTGGFGDPNGVKGPGNPNKGANINQGGSPQLPGGPGFGNGTGGAQGLRGTIASDGSGKGGSAVAAPPASNGVGIVYKPNPAYTDEARTLKAEGDVVLEVVFLASGQMQVVRVISGLGHGLDEAAIQAAKQIRFTPARRNGQPVDFPARVRIEFRLAK